MRLLPSFLLISFIVLFSISAQNESDYCTQWKSSCIDQMTPQELHITANILYLLYANSVIEYQIRRFLTPIQRLNQNIRIGILDYTDPHQDLVTLKTLVDRLSYIFSARTIYTQMLTTCLNEYNKKEPALINNALDSLQIYAQEELRKWANNNVSLLNEKLNSSSETLLNITNYLRVTAGLYKGIAEGDLPVEINEENQKNKSLIALSLFLNSTSKSLESTDTIVNNLDDTIDFTTEIIETGMNIYKQFYTIVYDTLMKDSYDQSYSTTLYSMYGYMPEEYKTVLPHPDALFQHILETTKLYMQTNTQNKKVSHE